MTDTATRKAPARAYWLKGNANKVASTLTGLLTVFVAIKAVSYVPGAESNFAFQDELVRFFAFAALTVWAALTVGIRRRGAVAVFTLAFASFLELVIVPGRGDVMGTLIFSNLGIVFAYCGLELYWFSLVQKRLRKKS